MWWGKSQGQTVSGAGNIASTMELDMGVQVEPTSDDSVVSGLHSLFGNEALCDVTFLLPGEEGQSTKIPVHAPVLAALSPSFRAYMKRHYQGAKRPDEMPDEDPMRGLLSLVTPAAPPVYEGATATDASPAVSGTPNGLPTESAPTTSATVPVAEASDAVPVSLSVGAGEQLPAAATPPVAAQGGPTPSLSSSPSAWPLEFQVHGISAPEALRLLLDYVHRVGTGMQWDYQPSSPRVNHDVLLLARQFELHQLHERAARWLTEGLNTANVVERLVTCEEFELGKLREKIMAELAARPQELAQVSGSMEIMRHPRILQDLLVQIASVQQRVISKPVEKEKSPEKAPEKPERMQPEKAPERTSDKHSERQSEKPSENKDKILEKAPQAPAKRPRKGLAGA